jgi:hypothetical protein
VFGNGRKLHLPRQTVYEFKYKICYYLLCHVAEKKFLKQTEIRCKKSDAISIAMNEITYVAGTGHHEMFIRGVGSNFNVAEDFAALCSMKGSVAGLQ